MTPSKQDEKLMPLKELAPFTPYAVGYLSLMARRGNLKVEKLKGTWFSTLENVKEFEILMNERKEARKKELSQKYHKKVATYKASGKKEDGGLKIKVQSGNIFDEVQNDLKEVLREIRNKEREIKRDYREYQRKNIRSGSRIETGMTPTPFSVAKAQKEREKGGEIAEKLILDLGKLLNTANQVQEGVEKIEDIKLNKDNDLVSIPVKTRANAIPQNKLYNAIEQITRPNEKEQELAIYPKYPDPLPFQDENWGEKAKKQRKILNIVILILFFITLVFLFVFIAFG